MLKYNTRSQIIWKSILKTSSGILIGPGRHFWCLDFKKQETNSKQQKSPWALPQKNVLHHQENTLTDADPGPRDPCVVAAMGKFTWTTEILWRKRDDMATF